MRRMPSLLVISTSAALTSSACARPSSAHGPAISTSGRSLPSVMSPIVTWRGVIARSPNCHPGEGRDPPVRLRVVSLLHRHRTGSVNAVVAAPWVPAFAGKWRLHQPRLVEGGLDERGEQRVRLER